jgi:sodium-dependent dicarboxylate transporter 2/3/5
MIVDTGLAAWLVSPLGAETLHPLTFAAGAGIAAVMLSNLMSNTAAANVLVPLTLSASAAAGPQAALTVALCASTAMALPVATPPNALAHASGRLRSRDFLLLGGIAAVLGPLVSTLWLAWLGVP